MTPQIRCSYILLLSRTRRPAALDPRATSLLTPAPCDPARRRPRPGDKCGGPGGKLERPALRLLARRAPTASLPRIARQVKSAPPRPSLRSSVHLARFQEVLGLEYGSLRSWGSFLLEIFTSFSLGSRAGSLVEFSCNLLHLSVWQNNIFSPA